MDPSPVLWETEWLGMAAPPHTSLRLSPLLTQPGLQMRGAVPILPHLVLSLTGTTTVRIYILVADWLPKRDKVITWLLSGPLVIAQRGLSVSKGQGLCEPFSEHAHLRGRGTAGNHGRKGATRPRKAGLKGRSLSRQVHLSRAAAWVDAVRRSLGQPESKGKSRLS